MLKKRSALLAGLAVMLVGAMPGLAGNIPTGYSFQTVISPSDPAFTQLLGINNSGTIAGYYGDGTVVANHGFTLTLPNQYTPENFPGAAQTQVIGINSSGMTAGFYTTTAGITNGFVNTAGTFTTVDAPSTAFNQLLGINDKGEEAGYSSPNTAGMTFQTPYIDNNGKFQYLTGLLPSAFSANNFGGGLNNAQATGINNLGDVSGFYMTNAGADSFGFLFNGKTLTSLEYPGSTFTQALGVNNEGEVVGTYIDSNGNMHGFIYGNGTYQTIDDPLGVGTTTVNGLNDKGNLVGFFVAGDNTEGFVASPTPEPAASLLFGTGLLGLAFLLRRRSIAVRG